MNILFLSNLPSWSPLILKPCPFIFVNAFIDWETGVYLFNWTSDNALFYSPRWKFFCFEKFNENSKWQIVFVLFLIVYAMPDGRCMYTCMLDLTTWTFSIAVKKSPSDIFVVFCLRSERLKICNRNYWEYIKGKNVSTSFERYL